MRTFDFEKINCFTLGNDGKIVEGIALDDSGKAVHFHHECRLSSHRPPETRDGRFYRAIAESTRGREMRFGAVTPQVHPACIYLHRHDAHRVETISVYSGWENPCRPLGVVMERLKELLPRTAFVPIRTESGDHIIRVGAGDVTAFLLSLAV